MNKESSFLFINMGEMSIEKLLKARETLSSQIAVAKDKLHSLEETNRLSKVKLESLGFDLENEDPDALIESLIAEAEAELTEVNTRLEQSSSLINFERVTV